jgi:cell wall-associated NlpC family hydrolase
MSPRTALRRRGIAQRGPLALLGLVVALLLGVTTAVPASGDEITDARAEAERIADRIEELQHESEALTEEYLDAKLAREQLDERIAEAEERAQRSGAELDELSGQLREVAVESFMSGGDVDHATQALMGAASAIDVGARRGYADSVESDGDDLVDSFRGVEAIARSDARTLEELRAEAERTEAAVRDNKDATEASLAELQELQDEVTGRLARLVEAEQARRDEARRRAAAERAAEAREQAAAEAAAADEPEPAPAPEASEAPAPTTQPDGPPAPPSTPPPAPPPAASGAQAAIAAARSVLGVPYRWAGASPEGGFDCSGLTMWAWAKGGKSLPHSSKAQYAMSAKIPASQLQPGDLVFYGSPISHVGLYIGNGEMIHAPHTGDVVKVSSIYYWSALVGGGRI